VRKTESFNLSKIVVKCMNFTENALAE